jgi:hypothetical protein
MALKWYLQQEWSTNELQRPRGISQALGSHFGGYKEVTRAQDGHSRGDRQSLKVVHVDSCYVVPVLLQGNTVPGDAVKLNEMFVW